jgi:hypothetical protein
MSSDYTYTTQDRSPYCYLIGWSQLDTWYYGRRTAKDCHPNDLWQSYYTSSNHVKRFREENGEPDVIQVRKVFSDTKSCCLWEDRVIHRIGAVKSSRWLNIHNHGYGKFNTTGRVTVIDNHGNSISVKCDDPRYISGELVHYRTGKVSVKDIKGNTFTVHKNDPRYISGELVHSSTGMKRCISKYPASCRCIQCGKIIEFRISEKSKVPSFCSNVCTRKNISDKSTTIWKIIDPYGNVSIEGSIVSYCKNVMPELYRGMAANLISHGKWKGFSACKVS